MHAVTIVAGQAETLFGETLSCPQDFGLKRGEKIQLANIHPTAPVDIHLVRSRSLGRIQT